MTFLKLNRNDFTKTKIKHKSHVFYDSAVENSFYDFNLRSKNAVNTEFIIDIPVLEKAIIGWNNHVGNYNTKYVAEIDGEERLALVKINTAFNDSQKQSIVDSLNTFRKNLKDVKNKELVDNINNVTNNEESDGFWDELRAISNSVQFNYPSGIDIPSGFVKYAISELFTTNEFKIKRVGQKFLPYSDELAKKNFIRDKLYRYYQDKIADADHKNISYTFTNYNTLNFCKIGRDNHSNAVVYPNPYIGSVHSYKFLDSNNFNVSFWLNKRKTDNPDKPQCILHIPHFLSIFTVDTDLNKFCIAIRGGNTADTRFSFTRNRSISRSDNTGDFVNTKIYGIYGNEKLFENNWHNISVNILTSAITSTALVSLFIDGELVGHNVINWGYDEDKNPTEENSLICFGNKINYENAVSFTYDTIFSQFFSKYKSLSNEKGLGPFYNKDISFGSINIESIDALDTQIKNIDNKFVEFSTFAGTSKENTINTQFEGELHDIRIYDRALSSDKIIDVSKNIVSNFEKEIEEFGLDFYVPVFYVPAEVKKKTLTNLHGDLTTGTGSNPGTNFNLPTQYYYKYNHIYNPVFANYCGGLELSIENYLIEFVKEVKPNVVIGSNENITSISDGLFYNGITDYLTFKDINNSGFTKSSFQKGQTLFEEFHKVSNSLNAKYYNSLILPNDNGIPNYSTDSINYLVNRSESSLDINSNFYFLQNQKNGVKYGVWSRINLTNTQELEEDGENHKYFQLDKKLDYSNSVIQGEDPAGYDDGGLQPSNISFGTPEITYQSTRDLVYDISNFYYHNGSFNSNDDDSVIDSKKSNFSRQYSHTTSNPVERNFLDSVGQLPNNGNVDLDGNGSDIAIYNKFTLPYHDINLEDCNFFNVYFDITNNLYGDKISPNSFVFTNKSLNYSDLILKDNGESGVYRANCLTKQAKWNIVGNLFYNEGILNINNPTICYIGLEDFTFSLKGENNVFVSEINLPLSSGKFDFSNNVTYDSSLRHDKNGINSEESFVYITDINLHDENYNIIANAKMAHPIPKKPSDKFVIRLKMDY